MEKIFSDKTAKNSRKTGGTEWRQQVQKSNKNMKKQT